MLIVKKYRYQIWILLFQSIYKQENKREREREREIALYALEKRLTIGLRTDTNRVIMIS